MLIEERLIEARLKEKRFFNDLSKGNQQACIRLIQKLKDYVNINLQEKELNLFINTINEQQFISVVKNFDYIDNTAIDPEGKPIKEYLCYRLLLSNFFNVDTEESFKYFKECIANNRETHNYLKLFDEKFIEQAFKENETIFNFLNSDVNPAFNTLLVNKEQFHGLIKRQGNAHNGIYDLLESENIEEFTYNKIIKGLENILKTLNSVEDINKNVIKNFPFMRNIYHYEDNNGQVVEGTRLNNLPPQAIKLFKSKIILKENTTIAEFKAQVESFLHSKEDFKKTIKQESTLACVMPKECSGKESAPVVEANASQVQANAPQVKGYCR